MGGDEQMRDAHASHEAVMDDQGGDQALVVSTGDRPLEYAIAAWLDAKGRRTGSAKTRTAYESILTRFRRYLLARRLDLDSESSLIADAAQVWCAAPWAELRQGQGQGQGREVAASTYNQRLAVLSSFYTFARKRQHLRLDNPIDWLERRPVQAYANARPMEAATIATRLEAIDRTSVLGLRDYALLMVALTTGRRLSELAALRWRDVEQVEERITLTFTHAKGAKVLHDTLTSAVAAALVAYLEVAYRERLYELRPDAAIWLSFAPRAYRQPLGPQGIADTCERWLGTSKMHTTRHSFAFWMEEAGAKVSEIQARLGHANVATTGRYLAGMRSAENRYSETLAALFGGKTG